MGSSNTKNNECEYSETLINEHIKNGKIIIIVDGNVYDVSKFPKYHPGGEGCLINRNGKDCSRDLKFHSNEAKDMLKLFYIGKKVGKS